MIKITDEKLIGLCELYKTKKYNQGINGDVFFEKSSKFMYEKKFFGEGFFYSPIMKYSFTKMFALKF